MKKLVAVLISIGILLLVSVTYKYSTAKNTIEFNVRILLDSLQTNISTLTDSNNKLSDEAKAKINGRAFDIYYGLEDILENNYSVFLERNIQNIKKITDQVALNEINLLANSLTDAIVNDLSKGAKTLSKSDSEVHSILLKIEKVIKKNL